MAQSHCLAGMRPLGRPRRRWEENIRMDIKVTVGSVRNAMVSAQNKIITGELL